MDRLDQLGNKIEVENVTDTENIQIVLNEIGKMVSKKNKDYGDSYTQTRKKYTHLAFLVQLEHKINRYKQLMREDRNVEEESIKDTLKDIIGYTALEIDYLDRME